MFDFDCLFISSRYIASYVTDILLSYISIMIRNAIPS